MSAPSFESCLAFVKRALVNLGQTAPQSVQDECARKVQESMKFLDGRTAEKYPCGYAGCEMTTNVPHGHN